MISAGEVHLPGRAVPSRPSAPEDFRDLAAAGVSMLGEIGLGGVKTAPEAKKMVGWARAHGLQSTIHTGGPSIPGSGLIDADAPQTLSASSRWRSPRSVQAERIILGTDSPAGSGVQPLGILRLLAFLSTSAMFRRSRRSASPRATRRGRAASIAAWSSRDAPQTSSSWTGHSIRQGAISLTVSARATSPGSVWSSSTG
jgi:hypothetical protein